MELSQLFVSENGKLCIEVWTTSLRPTSWTEKNQKNIYEIVGLITYDRFKLVAI